jgi:Fic family protein
MEFIHPFGDGNGRTGRLIEFYILLRSGAPIITSHILSNFYNETRPEYYRQFENARKKKDLTEFLQYAVLGYRDGLLQTFDVVIVKLHHLGMIDLLFLFLESSERHGLAFVVPPRPVWENSRSSKDEPPLGFLIFLYLLIDFITM